MDQPMLTRELTPPANALVLDRRRDEEISLKSQGPLLESVFAGCPSEPKFRNAVGRGVNECIVVSCCCLVQHPRAPERVFGACKYSLI